MLVNSLRCAVTLPGKSRFMYQKEDKPTSDLVRAYHWVAYEHPSLICCNVHYLHIYLTCRELENFMTN